MPFEGGWDPAWRGSEKSDLFCKLTYILDKGAFYRNLGEYLEPVENRVGIFLFKNKNKFFAYSDIEIRNRLDVGTINEIIEEKKKNNFKRVHFMETKIMKGEGENLEFFLGENSESLMTKRVPKEDIPFMHDIINDDFSYFRDSHKKESIYDFMNIKYKSDIKNKAIKLGIISKKEGLILKYNFYNSKNEASLFLEVWPHNYETIYSSNKESRDSHRMYNLHKKHKEPITIHLV